MTAKRDLKKLVRERQARTGESYVTALRQVRAQRVDSDGAISVVELVDLTEVGAPLGYKCRITITPTLLARIDAAAALTKLRDVMLATRRDRDLLLMMQVTLGGLLPAQARLPKYIDNLKAFFARARAGLGGVSEGGRLVAMTVDGKAGSVMVLFVVSGSAAPMQRPPSLGLSEVPDADDTPLDWLALPW